MEFTAEQADALNRWQRSGHAEPYACPREHGTALALVASTSGWSCPAKGCGYASAGLPAGLVVPGRLSAEGVWTREAVGAL